MEVLQKWAPEEISYLFRFLIDKTHKPTEFLSLADSLADFKRRNPSSGVTMEEVMELCIIISTKQGDLADFGRKFVYIYQIPVQMEARIGLLEGGRFNEENRLFAFSHTNGYPIGVRNRKDLLKLIRRQMLDYQRTLTSADLAVKYFEWRKKFGMPPLYLEYTKQVFQDVCQNIIQSPYPDLHRIMMLMVTGTPMDEQLRKEWKEDCLFDEEGRIHLYIKDADVLNKYYPRAISNTDPKGASKSPIADQHVQVTDQSKMDYALVPSKSQVDGLPSDTYDSEPPTKRAKLDNHSSSSDSFVSASSRNLLSTPSTSFQDSTSLPSSSASSQIDMETVRNLNEREASTLVNFLQENCRKSTEFLNLSDACDDFNLEFPSINTTVESIRRLLIAVSTQDSKLTKRVGESAQGVFLIYMFKVEVAQKDRTGLLESAKFDGDDILVESKFIRNPAIAFPSSYTIIKFIYGFAEKYETTMSDGDLAERFLDERKRKGSHPIDFEFMREMIRDACRNIYKARYSVVNLVKMLMLTGTPVNEEFRMKVLNRNEDMLLDEHERILEYYPESNYLQKTYDDVPFSHPFSMKKVKQESYSDYFQDDELPSTSTREISTLQFLNLKFSVKSEMVDPEMEELMSHSPSIKHEMIDPKFESVSIKQEFDSKPALAPVAHLKRPKREEMKQEEVPEEPIAPEDFENALAELSTVGLRNGFESINKSIEREFNGQ